MKFSRLNYHWTHDSLHPQHTVRASLPYYTCLSRYQSPYQQGVWVITFETPITSAFCDRFRWNLALSLRYAHICHLCSMLEFQVDRSTRDRVTTNRARSVLNRRSTKGRSPASKYGAAQKTCINRAVYDQSMWNSGHRYDDTICCRKVMNVLDQYRLPCSDHSGVMQGPKMSDDSSQFSQPPTTTPAVAGTWYVRTWV